MAENDDDIELPALVERAEKPPQLSAARCIVDAVIAKAVPRDIRLRLLRNEVLTVVVTVPSLSWVKAVERRANQLLGKSWSSIARDGSMKWQVADTGNEEVVSLLGKARGVVGIAVSERTLPSALTMMADIRIVIANPDAGVVSNAVARYTSEKVCPETAVGAAGLDFYQLCAAFRPDSTAQQIFERIRAGQRMLAPQALEYHQDLEDAVEYGVARQWGLELAEDFAECIAGRRSWNEITSHSAIMFGAPGLGKTHFAHLLAHKLGATLIMTSVADLFAHSSGYLDAVVKSLVATYEKAEQNKPALVVWDEFDALPSRVGLDSRASSYWDTVITSFMIEVSKYRPLVAQLAITNFKDKVDPALLRPGRFGTHLELKRPDEVDVISILRAQLNGELPDTELAGIGGIAIQRTAAELAEAVRKARRAARVDKRQLEISDLLQALVPSDAMPAGKLRRIATHEAGHVVTALALDFDTVVLAAIGGLDGAHGHTVFRPSGDLEGVESIEGRIIVRLSGRAGEIAVFGDCVAGSSSDLQEATIELGTMITEEGLGGILTHLADRNTIESMLRMDLVLRGQVERRLQALGDRALEIVSRHRAAVEAIATVLADRRFISGFDARRIFDASAVASVEAVPNK